MARKPNPKAAQADEFVGPPAPQAAPVAAPATPSGPLIEFIGEGADKVKFTINPKATRYQVYADGAVVETL